MNNLWIWIFIFSLVFLAFLILFLRLLVSSSESFLPDHERFSYYFPSSALELTNPSLKELHRIYSNEFSNDELKLNFQQCKHLWENRFSIHLPFPTSYLEDLYTIWSLLEPFYQTPDRVVVWYPRDRVERFAFPVLVKSRIIKDSMNEKGSILFKLHSQRHFKPMEEVWETKKTEKSFQDKISKLVWRGVSTGYGFGNQIPFRTVSRETLVKKFASSHSSLLDIGLTHLVESSKNNEDYKKYEKNTISRKELLDYKYLLSVEGHDVATNLKWIMASNSLVVMPRPQIESWFMENSLVPYVHYLPVQDDFEDLESQIEWAERNPEECEKMIQNAHSYIQSFLDKNKEEKLLVAIFQSYLENFSWKE